MVDACSPLQKDLSKTVKKRRRTSPAYPRMTTESGVQRAKTDELDTMTGVQVRRRRKKQVLEPIAETEELACFADLEALTSRIDQFTADVNCLIHRYRHENAVMREFLRQ
jgi:hypothetical protein